MGNEKGLQTSDRKLMNVDGWMILKWVFVEQGVRLWNELGSGSGSVEGFVNTALDD
jgi:hypothetical protein